MTVGKSLKVAFLMGNRLNAWHTRMYEPLIEMGVHLKAFTYPPHRYPLDEVRIPYEIIPTQAEVRTLPQRVGEGIANRVMGTLIDEEPSGLSDRLGDFDLIHTWELFTADTEAALAARERWGKRVLVTVWDNIPGHRDDDPRWRNRKIRAKQGADRFLVYTHDSRKMLIEEGVDPTRIILIPPAIDQNDFRPVVEVPRVSTLMGVGRMVPEKGFEDLIEAAAILNKDPNHSPVKVRLLGSGPHEEAIDSLARSSGLEDSYKRVPSLPYSQLPDFLRQGSVLVLGSRSTPEWREQFGMILIEAMASGVPVIGAQSGAIPEIVGDAGGLYRPGAIEELVEGLRELLGNERFWKRCREKGIDRCRREFSHLDNSRAVFHLYESMVS